LPAAFFGVGLTRFDAFCASLVVSQSVSLFWMSLVSVPVLSTLLRVVRVVVESGVKNEAMLAGGMMEVLDDEGKGQDLGSWWTMRKRKRRERKDENENEVVLCIRH